MTRISDAFLSGQLHWHAFWQNAYSGGGFTLGAGYLQHVSPYNSLDVRGSITFSGYKRIEAEFIAPELFARRGTLSVLGGWREATQVSFYGLGRRRRRRTWRTTGSRSRTSAPTSKSFRRGSCSSSAGGVEVSQWKQGAGLGQLAVGRAEVHARDAAGPRRVAGLPPHAGDRRLRLAAGARLHAARRLLRRDGPRLHRQGRRVRLQPGRLHGDSAHPDPARGLGARVPRVRADDLRQERPADSVLHDAVVQRRLRPARLLELAPPRPEQPAAAGRVARDRQPVPRDGALLRRRQGRRQAKRSGPARHEERLRPRLPLPRPDRRRRCGSSWRRATKASC